MRFGRSLRGPRVRVALCWQGLGLPSIVFMSLFALRAFRLCILGLVLGVLRTLLFLKRR